MRKVRSGYRYYRPELGRWPSRDPIGEFDGANVYEFAGNAPVTHVDILGLAWYDPSPLPPKELDGPCCICATEPSKCKITIRWTGKVEYARRYNMTLAPSVSYNVEEAWFGTAALVVLKHTGGKSVKGCHLHQGVEKGQIWETGNWVETSEPNDYGSGVNPPTYAYYGGTWLFDSPWRIWGPRGTGSLPDPVCIWFQAHVYVEEATAVADWWGFAGTAKWNRPNQPRWRYTRWRNVKKYPFCPYVP